MLDVKDLCFRKALYSTLTCIRACKTLYYQSSRTLTYNYVNVSCIRFTLDDKRCTAAHLLVYSIHANKFLIIDFNTMLWMNFIQLIILYDQLYDLNGSVSFVVATLLLRDPASAWYLHREPLYVYIQHTKCRIILVCIICISLHYKSLPWLRNAWLYNWRENRQAIDEIFSCIKLCVSSQK